MSELTTALSSAMQLIGLARLAVDARDDAKAKAALTDLTQKLNDVSISALASTERAMSLQVKLGEAQEEARLLRQRASEREKYSLVEVCPGSFGYASLTSTVGESAQMHFLCQPCYDKNVKSIFRFAKASSSHNEHWDCPEGGIAHRITKYGTQLSMPLFGARFNP